MTKHEELRLVDGQLKVAHAGWQKHFDLVNTYDAAIDRLDAKREKILAQELEVEE